METKVLPTFTLRASLIACGGRTNAERSLVAAEGSTREVPGGDPMNGETAGAVLPGTGRADLREPNRRPLPAAGLRPAEVVVVGTGGIRVIDLLGPLPHVRPPRLVSSLAALARIRADLVILRSDTPSRDVRALNQVPGPSRVVLVVTGSPSQHEVTESLRAGATSYLVDGQYTRADLINAVLGTLNRHSHLSQAAVTAAVRQLREESGRPVERAEAEMLSLRQREIMALLAAGRSNADIAARLVLAEKTVRNHISAIYTKLRVNSRAEAIVYWLGRPVDDEARAS
jgi:DNA-binding NarL/FixJ family response regulator